MAAAEVVSLHCPLLPQACGIVNASSLSKMKPRSFLIIISRGPLVVEQDLAAAPASQEPLFCLRRRLSRALQSLSRSRPLVEPVLISSEPPVGFEPATC